MRERFQHTENARAIGEPACRNGIVGAKSRMRNMKTFKIAVFAGDGIGPEVTTPCIEILNAAASRVGGFALDYQDCPAGANCYVETGEALPAASVEVARAADAILLAAAGDPKVRYPDGTEIVPQIDLRMILNLYAGVRPVRAIAGVPGPLRDTRAENLDFVLIRESTEGLFASMKKGTVTADQAATETLVITRHLCERLFDFSFELARRRKAEGHPGRVMCVDKANVFTAFAFFRRIFEERAERYPDIEAEFGYVDAIALDMVRRPWRFDVMVTENMFGDILSDLGAGLVGGLGMAPSADMGDRHALFQPCHGTAPDIAGQGLANPTAMILSGAMMLEHLGRDHAPCLEAAKRIRAAVDGAFRDAKLVSCEFGGRDGTGAISKAVLERL